MRQRLLARMRRRYQVITETLNIGPLRIRFTRITDPNVVLDMVAEEEDRRDRLSGRRRDGDELHLPYWAELWDSAVGIARFLVRLEGEKLLQSQETATAAPSVLDLGCGMGLAGTVAAALGARVVFADLESPALVLAAVNSIPWRKRIRTRRLNWRTDELRERFDLIIGADILYERAQWPHLERFWRKHLAEKGRVLLGEPGRQTGDDFPAWIAQRGWALELFQQPVPSRGSPIRLFHIRLR